jgi:hypothetical protein
VEKRRAQTGFIVKVVIQDYRTITALRSKTKTQRFDSALDNTERPEHKLSANITAVQWG